MSGPIKLGTGVLTWHPSERRSDRYGTVWLIDSSDGVILESAVHVPLVNLPQTGTAGKLFVRVLEARKSHHIGDLFRGIFPSTPASGETIVLGEGSFFKEQSDEVGLRPVEERRSDWLDPNALYRAHDQTVELY